METIEEINVALAQLRESLANLDAARVQVSQVTGGSREVVEAAARLSDDVKLLADRIGQETLTVIARFTERLDDARTEWTGAIDDGKARFATEIEQTRLATAQLKADAERTLQQALTASTQSVNDLNAATQETLRQAAATSTQTVADLNAATQETLRQAAATSTQTVAELNAATQETLRQAAAASTQTVAELKAETQETLRQAAAASTQTVAELKAETQAALQQSLDTTTRTLDEVGGLAKQTVTEVSDLAKHALNEVTTVSTDAIEMQQSEIADTLDTLADYNERIRSLIEALKASNLAEQITALERKVDAHTAERAADIAALRADANRNKKMQLIAYAVIAALFLLLLFLK